MTLLQPVSTQPVAGARFVCSIVGQAVLDWGASGSVEVNEIGGSDEVTTSWDCEGNRCVEKQGASGVYETLASCQALCDACLESGGSADWGAVLAAKKKGEPQQIQRGSGLGG